jgi:hypothetical protein
MQANKIMRASLIQAWRLMCPVCAWMQHVPVCICMCVPGCAPCVPGCAPCVPGCAPCVPGCAPCVPGWAPCAGRHPRVVQTGPRVVRREGLVHTPVWCGQGQVHTPVWCEQGLPHTLPILFRTTPGSALPDPVNTTRVCLQTRSAPHGGVHHTPSAPRVCPQTRSAPHGGVHHTPSAPPDPIRTTRGCASHSFRPPHMGIRSSTTDKHTHVYVRIHFGSDPEVHYSFWL